MNESKYLMINNDINTDIQTPIVEYGVSRTSLDNSADSVVMTSQKTPNVLSNSVVNSNTLKNSTINNATENSNPTSGLVHSPQQPAFSKSYSDLEKPVSNSNDSDIEDDNDEILVMTYETGDKKKIIDPTIDQTNALSKYFNVNTTATGARWSRSVETVILSYRKKAIGYKVLYNNSYYKYMKLYRLFKWPLVFFTLVSLILQVIRSTLLSSDDLGNSEVYRFTMNITTTVATGLIAVFTYLQADKNYKNSAYGCKKASIAFGTFSEEIGTILAIPRSSRANPFQVLSGIQSDLSKLIKTYEDYEIPTSIYNEFDKKYNTDKSLAKSKKTNKTLIDENEILTKFVQNVQQLHSSDIENMNSRSYSYV